MPQPWAGSTFLTNSLQRGWRGRALRWRRGARHDLSALMSRPLTGGLKHLSEAEKTIGRRFPAEDPRHHGRAFSVKGRGSTLIGDIRTIHRSEVHLVHQKRRHFRANWPAPGCCSALVVVGGIGFSTLGGLGCSSQCGGNLRTGMGSLPGVHRETTCPKRRAGGHTLANGSVFLVTLGAGVMAGGALSQQMLLSAGLGTPSTTFTIVHPPFGAASASSSSP